MTEDPHAPLIAAIRDALGADARVDGAWLSGSLGRGEGDAFSDVDVVVAVEDEDLGACVAEYGGVKSPLGAAVFRQVLYGRIVTAVTPDWRRYDLQFVTGPELRRLDFAKLRPLTPGAKPPPGLLPPRAPPARRPQDLVPMAEEFLRILGLLPVALGRREWLVAQEGWGLMRKLTIDLMVEANGRTSDRGGVKRLNAFLTDGQREALEALAWPGPSRESLIAANQALSGLFIPLGRTLLGEAWPSAFESATRDHLREALGIELP
ncbi:MAG TPA: hypothetical protein VG939_08765 [Caulobacteraceae bacterium]|nr:hypothetical protein [Caulobacteraceae bacterium]